MSKKTIALNIVLLPEPAVNKLLQNYNSLLVENFNSEINFSQGAIPHLTLAMGLIAEEDLHMVLRELESIRSSFEEVLLRPKRIDSAAISQTHSISWIEFEADLILRKLHLQMLSLLDSYYINDMAIDSFFTPEKINITTMEWLAAFKDNSRDGKYAATMTIGMGDIKKVLEEDLIAELSDFPAEIKFPELALCQLGIYCSCQKLLSL